MNRNKDNQNLSTEFGAAPIPDIFSTHLEKNKRILKKKLLESSLLPQEKKQIELEIQKIEKLKKGYLAVIGQDNLSPKQFSEAILFQETQQRIQQDLLNKVADLIYFAKLAHIGKIQSEPLSKFYEDNLAERKSLCEMTYKQEREQLYESLERYAGGVGNCELSQEISLIDRSLLNENIQPQILELDEDFEEEEEEDQEQLYWMDSSNIVGDHSGAEEEDESNNYQKNQYVRTNDAIEGDQLQGKEFNSNRQLNIKSKRQQGKFQLGHVHSQNYDGDSEKSHTENELDKKKGGYNANNSQELVDNNDNSNNSSTNNNNNTGGNCAIRGFRRYKQNRYREERFAYQKKAKLQQQQQQQQQQSQYNEEDSGKDEIIVKSNMGNNNAITNKDEYESDLYTNQLNEDIVDILDQYSSSNSKQQDLSNTSNNNIDQTSTEQLSSQQIHNAPSKTQSRKHQIPQRNRHIPKQDNEYETDREKDKKNELLTSKKVQQQPHQQEHDLPSGNE